MSNTFKGKFLLRKSKLPDGTPVIMLCGTVVDDGSLGYIDDADEMWAMQCDIEQVIKFKPLPDSTGNYSPEDFLANAGNIQHPLMWRREGWTEKQHCEKYSR